MQFREVCKEVAGKCDLTQKDVEKVLKTYAEVAKEWVKEGNEIPLAGLGKFKMKEFSAREGFNPQTQQKVKYPGGKKPVFKISPTVVNELKVLE